MNARHHALIPFAVIMCVIYSGIYHLSWWSAVAGACALALFSLASPTGSIAHHQRSRIAVSMPVLFLSTTTNAATAAVIAYVFGRIIGWVWGV